MDLYAQSSQLEIYKGLAGAYVKGQETAVSLYHKHFRDPDSFRTRLQELDQGVWDRAALCDALEAYNVSLGCREKTLEHLKALRGDEAVVVVTGQQAGIFTGALYTVYKAITALKLAKVQSEHLGRPVVPVFWVASEDHDFHEIRAAQYLSAGKVRKVVIDKADKSNLRRVNLKKMSVGHLALNDSVKASIEQILSDFSGRGELDHMEALLSTTFVERESLSTWFGRIMTRLFHDYGLVMLDPMLPALRALESKFFMTALERQTAVVAALDVQTKAIESLGYRGAIEFDPQGLQLFVYEQEERLALRRVPEQNRYYCESAAHGTRYDYDLEDLRARITARPQDFSTNVVLRPVVQDVLLPTLAYVAGPGELNYYGQLRVVYEVFGQRQPVLYPRENFTLVQDAVSKVLDQYALSPEDVLMCGVSAIRDHLLDLRDEVRIDQLFEAYMEKFEVEYRSLIQKVLEISPDLQTLSEKNIHLIKSQISYLKEKAHRFHRRNHRQIVQDLSEVEAHLMPGGNLQERTLSILQYYAEAGHSLIDFLIREVPLDPEHRIILLGFKTDSGSGSVVKE